MELTELAPDQVNEYVAYVAMVLAETSWKQNRRPTIIDGVHCQGWETYDLVRPSATVDQYLEFKERFACIPGFAEKQLERWMLTKPNQTSETRE